MGKIFVLKKLVSEKKVFTFVRKPNWIKNFYFEKLLSEKRSLHFQDASAPFSLPKVVSKYATDYIM